MEIITINNTNYVQGDFVFINAPIYSSRCRSSRELIRTKNIDSTNFIYAKKIKDKWVQTEGKSIKFDKVMIKEDLIKDIPELNNTNTIVSDDNSIEKAPNIIYLNDSEKFKDGDNIFNSIINIKSYSF